LAPRAVDGPPTVRLTVAGGGRQETVRGGGLVARGRLGKVAGWQREGGEWVDSNG
jgi:hypothetical protein